MDAAVRDACAALTEKEKQTLRLMVRGHDAKSIARNLGLSVHTINERLREARRKMAVSSSREAARVLLGAEGGDLVSADPKLFGYEKIGADAADPAMDQDTASISGVGWQQRQPWINIGFLLMTIALGLLALTALSNFAATPLSAPGASQTAPKSEVVDTARHWLALLDQSRWEDSYAATSASFRKMNTAQVWAAVSQKVRAPLGTVISRTFVSQENLPAPPHGYEVVKFSTRFANNPAAVETVTLNHEAGGWRVVGVTIK